MRAGCLPAIPIGLVFGTEAGNSTDVPFPGWRYCPEYFRPDQCFHVGENSELFKEPLCIYMPPNLPLPEPHPRRDNPHMTVTELRFSVPVMRPSLTLAAIADCEGISLRLNEPDRLEIVFNEKKECKSKDMSPELPLVIHW
jgi:hypothetical protein